MWWSFLVVIASPQFVIGRTFCPAQTPPFCNFQCIHSLPRNNYENAFKDWIIRLELCISVGATGHYCLQCDEVAKPEYCDTVKRCGIHENCYIDTRVSSAGIIRYDLGCRDTHTCRQTQVTGKRTAYRTLNETSQGDVTASAYKRSRAYLVCSQCCVGDVCNSKGCGNNGYPSPKGPVCFDCPIQISPEDCSKIMLCNEDQVCMLLKTMDHVTHKQVYESKCEDEQVCNDAKQVSLAFIGKRRKRDFLGGGDSCIMQCCNSSLCNNKCNNVPSSTLLSTPSATQAVKTSTMISTTTRLDPCLSNPCHMGICSPYDNTYRCTCDHGIYGRNCDQVAISTSTTARPTTAFVAYTVHQTAFCMDENKMYRQGDIWQVWHDGCQLKCSCEDARNGFYTCRKLCPDFNNLPAVCTLEKNPGECCPQVRCNGQSLSHACRDELTNCTAYDASYCTKFRPWATNNCAFTCNLC